MTILSLGHVLGSDQGSWYGFWSGLGADLGEIAFIGAAIGIYRKHNCHVHKCWRLAKQQVSGTTWMVCHKHHPAGKPTVEVLDAMRQDIKKLQAEHVTVEEQLDDQPLSSAAPRTTAGATGPDATVGS